MDDQTLDVMGAIALDSIFDGDFEKNPITTDAGASDSGDTSAAPVDAQPRGADGKFVKAEEVPDSEGYTEEVPVGEEEPGESEVEQAQSADDEGDGLEADTDGEEEGDEIVLELDEGVLELVNTKYDGDIGKALEALQDAQSVIGRQGTELGELRELRTQVESLRELMTLQQAGSGIDWDDEIADNPEAAVVKAVQFQNVGAFEAAMDAWAATEPLKAFTFLQELNEVQNAPEPTSLEAELEALKGRYPDLQQRLPAIEKLAGERPALARLLSDQDPRTRAQALEDLYHLSAGAGTPDTSKAARRIVLQARAEADAAKADAAVVSASNTAPPPPPVKSGDTALAETLQEYLGLGDDFKIVG